MEGKFNSKYDVTVGVEFGTKTIQINGDPIKLQIWDTAGQETFKSITRSYYRGAAAAIVVYDITKAQTFKNIPNWLNEIKTYGNKQISIILIGNKKDMDVQRQVSYAEGKHFADQNNLLFLEASAKTSDSVEHAYLTTAQEVIQKIDKEIIDLDDPEVNFIPRNSRTLVSKEVTWQITRQK